MKIPIIWVIVFCLTCFIGGVLTMFGIYSGLPAKTVIQNMNSVQNVENKNTSIQESSQAQLTTTVITGNTNYHISVNYNGRTNYKYTFSSHTNRMSRTNKTKDKNFIGVPIP